MSDPTPPPNHSRRNALLVAGAVVLLFVGLRGLSHWIDPDGTGSATGAPGRGCSDQQGAIGQIGEEPSPELEAELRERLGDPEAWMLPAVPSDGDWSAFPQDPKNPLTQEKIDLGRELFHEPGMMVATPEVPGSGTWSCATCHDGRAAFSSGAVTGRGIGRGGVGELGDRAVGWDLPTNKIDLGQWNDRRLVNLAWTARSAGWLGDFDMDDERGWVGHMLPAGFEGLEAFVFASLGNHGAFDEGESTPPEGSALLEEAYLPMFSAAFPRIQSSEQITRMEVSLAIAAYLRTLSTSEAPFQLFLRQSGERDSDEPALMSEQAMEGALVFFGEGRCTACHKGPALASTQYEALGNRAILLDEELPGWVPASEEPEGPNGWGSLAQFYAGSAPQNRGRHFVTGEDEDLGKYRVVSVYGAGNANVLAWGHGAAHDNLGDFLAHKVGGKDPEVNTTLDPELVDQLSPVLFSSDEPFLSEEQIDQLVAFIEEGLEDPGVAERHGLFEPTSLAGYKR